MKLTGDLVLLLEATTLLNTKLLFVTLLSPYVPGDFEGVVDSGSFDCFMDLDFAAKKGLLQQEIAPLPIALIDGAINTYITHVISLQIEFACGYSCVFEYFVTKLEGFYLIVLGYNWLTQHNQIIDWKKSLLVFSAQDQSKPVQKPKSSINYPSSDQLSP